MSVLTAIYSRRTTVFFAASLSSPSFTTQGSYALWGPCGVYVHGAALTVGFAQRAALTFK